MAERTPTTLEARKNADGGSVLALFGRPGWKQLASVLLLTLLMAAVALYSMLLLRVIAPLGIAFSLSVLIYGLFAARRARIARAASRSSRGRIGGIYRNLSQRIDKPGWKEFGIATIALIIAFLLAVYSSIFAQEGRLVATAVCATAALALAGYVAVTVVPFLARRTRVEWLRVSLDFKLTKEGIGFIALIFLLAIAGLNTGNNLLYLILSSLLAAILMSGILSLAVLTGVELEVLLPEHVFARRPAPARVILHNLKRYAPSFSIALTGEQPDNQRGGRDAAPAMQASQPSGQILRRPLYFPFLPARTKVSRTVELNFPRRGLYREEAFALSTRFPFGFLEKRLRLPLSRELLVYPAVTPTEQFYEILPMLTGEIEAYQRGRGNDLYSIRDLLPTDSARHVDWKASARTRSLKVREFAREDERRLLLVFDPRIGEATSERLRRFETALEFCACLAWHFYEIDAQLQFRCGGVETPLARAEEIVYDVLRILAQVRPSSEEPTAPPVGADPSLFRIICTALPQGSVPTQVWSHSYFVFFDALRDAPDPAPVA